MHNAQQNLEFNRLQSMPWKGILVLKSRVYIHEEIPLYNFYKFDDENASVVLTLEIDLKNLNLYGSSLTRHINNVPFQVLSWYLLTLL